MPPFRTLLSAGPDCFCKSLVHISSANTQSWGQVPLTFASDYRDCSISMKESTCKSVCKDFTFLFAIINALPIKNVEMWLTLNQILTAFGSKTYAPLKVLLKNATFASGLLFATYNLLPVG